MTPVLLHIFFHGLIAFVHNRPAGGMMSAYALADAEHGTFVIFQMKGSSECKDADLGFAQCSIVEESASDWCLCQIIDLADISFNPDSLIDPKVKLPGKPLSARPLRLESTSDPSWLVKMSDVDKDGGGAKSLGEVSNEVRADLSFGWQRAETCHLDQVRDQEECLTGKCEYKIYPNKFVTTVSGSEGHVQALAEGVMFDVSFPRSPVRLHITNRRRADQYLEATLDCSDECPDLLIANDVFEHGDGESDVLQDIGMHFLSYYKIARDNPKKRFPVRVREDSGFLPVGNSQYTRCSADPSLLFSQMTDRNKLGKQKTSPSRGEQLLALFEKVVAASYQTRVICPMAVFEN